MHYPFWFVPFLTSPMLIAIIAVLHVVVSHYAVGGGFFLAVETGFAYRTRHGAYLAYLKDHAWFFILITVVYGAVTGVGIWWTIGLASPLATEMLIHIFMFGWAMEYVFFLLEIAAAFIFFYYWGRLDVRTHRTMAWIYAGSAWMSLVLITAITAFMLHPGAWPQHRNFWVAFFNPQFIPQVLARTGGSFLLASLYVYLHAAFRVRDSALRDLIARRSARPALLGAMLVLVGGATWYAFLPASARTALPAASLLNVLVVLLFAITLAVWLMLYFGPYRNPGWLSPGFGILLFSFGLAAVAVGEHIREAVRKPYILYNVVLSNQILVDEVQCFQQAGYLSGGTWTSVHLRAPEAATRLAQGRTLYLYHCASCHSDARGFSALGELMRGWDEPMVRELVRAPEKVRFFMPPWAGTAEEGDLLTEYLVTIIPGRPAGMNLGEPGRQP